MAALTIRNLDERTKAQLRIQAARHGRSMEETARTMALTPSVIQFSSTPGGRAAPGSGPRPAGR
jgi:plasmid stability protein